MLSSVLSLYVRYEFSFMDVQKEFWEAVLEAYLINVVITLIIFYIFRLYNSVWRYASDTELVNIIIAVVICAAMAAGDLLDPEYPCAQKLSLLLCFFHDDVYRRSQIQLPDHEDAAEQKIKPHWGKITD